MLRSIPEDVIHKIYKHYYSTYVMPDVQDKCKPYKQSSLSIMNTQFQDALSKCNMYTEGALDVSNVAIDVWKVVYVELIDAGMNVNLSVKDGKLLLLAQHVSRCARYDEPAFHVPSVLQHDSHQYIISYHPQQYDLFSNPMVYWINPVRYSVRAGWDLMETCQLNAATP